MADIQVLTDLIEPEATALGFALVRVKMLGSEAERTLQVMAERPDTRQLTIDDCAALSRRISEKFDEIDPIEEAYRLEVSSPGIDRPLTRLQDFTDWASHDARILLVEPQDNRKQVTCTITGVDGTEILVEVNKQGGPMRIDFANISTAKLVFTNRLLKATAPLISEGAEEFITEDAPEGADNVQLEGQE